VERTTDITASRGASLDRGARELLRRVDRFAALEDPDAIAREVLSAALAVVDADTAILMGIDDEGALQPRWATGPLAVSLAERAAGDLETLRRSPETLLAVGLSNDDGQLTGALVLASRDAPAPSPADRELIELLAMHAERCLRHAALMGSLRERAASDALTGLGHQASFHEALAGSHRRPRTAILVADVDGFKQLNDTYGHQHGDRVLCAVADALSGALRQGDALFRIGGDEFAALITVADEREALGAAKRLRQAVLSTDLDVTVSLGVAVPLDREADDAALARADRALYAAKEAGRDCVRLADAPPESAAATAR
jgi:diguanylate cyclase (GGDEF)-like protein